MNCLNCHFIYPLSSPSLLPLAQKQEMMKDSITQGVSSGFAALATAFIQESLSHMVPWLIVSCAVIVCDLCFGVRKSMLMKEEVRVSRAVRRTMGKMVTYFSFVCMVCMINVAAGNDYAIDRWACLLVCGIEFLSIISNILKPKGYNLNVKALVAALLGKAVGGSKEDFRDVIEKENPTKN